MDNNNEQEAGFDVSYAINDDNDGGDLFERIYLGDRLVNIPDVPFRLIIDASVTEIDNDACYSLRMLREIVFHNKVTRIGRRAFRGCRNLQQIELPAGLLRLESFAFHGCDSLQEILIPASVQYIGEDVFCWCSSVHRVVFAPRTTSIELGGRMFWRCSNLRFVTFPQNLRSIPVGFFQDCTSLTHLQIPASVEQIRVNAFRGSGIQAMNSSVGDDFMPGTIILPPKLRSISGRCFEDCKSLTHIRIPASVQSIGEDALNGSGLRLVEIPKRVQQIRSRAFKNCTYLERVTIYSTNLNLGPGKTNIFVNCPRLSTIMIAPWLWPKLFVSMSEHPQFIFQFFRHYHTKILDFETPDVRLFRQVRRDRKRTATMIDDG